MSLNLLIEKLNEIIWGWPLLISFTLISLYVTFALSGVQFRYFFTSLKLAFISEQNTQTNTEKEITVFEAFINSLGASIGNGNITGIPVAIYLGGPGAIFWMIVIGFISLSLRFAEVYLGTYFKDNSPGARASGGPMVYLSKIPGGKYLSFGYAILCFIYTIIGGNSMQCNAIAVGFQKTAAVNPAITGVILGIIMIYVVFGGARRIIAFSDSLVPIKVSAFLICSAILLFYHRSEIIPALQLIVKYAFEPVAIAGGTIGVTVNMAVRNGIAKGVNASEVGLGTASVIFGNTEKQDPVKKGIVSMLSAFITTHIICFIVGLSMVASGVWNHGETSAAMVISAYETVFGSVAGWIVSFYTVSFGFSVMVAYAYISRECWFFLTNRKYQKAFNVIYPLATFLGCLGSVKIVWNLIDLINAGMLVINLFGLMCLLKLVKQGLAFYKINSTSK